MHLTDSSFHEKIAIWRIICLFATRFYRLQEVQGVWQQEEAVSLMAGQGCLRKIKTIERLHMETTKGKVSFIITAVAYLLFNLRLAQDMMGTIQATLWQILQTAPYVVGITYVAVAIVQYMAEGEKIPWPQRFRLFFTIGIFAGLVYAIYEYTGAGIPQ